MAPFGQFLVLHVVADLLEQGAGLARKRCRTDEVVDAVNNTNRRVLAAPLAFLSGIESASNKVFRRLSRSPPFTMSTRLLTTQKQNIQLADHVMAFWLPSG
jgi:hypothetical protein